MDRNALLIYLRDLRDLDQRTDQTKEQASLKNQGSGCVHETVHNDESPS